MKKVFALILVGLCLLSLPCCNREEPENQTHVQRDEPSLYINSEGGAEETVPYVSEETRLIVNGKDITEGNYVRIDRIARHAELPITAVFKELGYDVEMKYDQNTDSYAVVIDEYVLIDTQHEDYGISVGTGDTKYVRRMIDNEIIVDSDSILGLMYWAYYAEIRIDYSTNTVYVDYNDPYSSTKYDAKLVINGKDITEGNCVSILEYDNYTDAELPLLAVATELGAEVDWKSDAIVAITYKGNTQTYDISNSDFGVYIPEGGVAIRRIENGDLIFNLMSIDSMLEEMFDVSISLDKEKYIVYIDSENENNRGILDWFRKS